MFAGLSQIKLSSTKCVTIAAGIAVAYTTVKYGREKWSNWEDRKRLRKLREQRQAERALQIQNLSTLYLEGIDKETASKYDTILQLNVRDLQEKLSKRELLAEDVLLAYLCKALKVSIKYNCVTEFCMPEALERARELDKMHMVKGALHGIPFAVKDDTRMEGYDCTVGCSHNLYNPSKSSATIIHTLEGLGAVKFCRTNVPQTCISLGSTNPIFGTTLNPINPKVSPGGSSSGTGCLVGAGGSPFGTGSDTGGSLRVPAHFNGVSTLKSTSTRLSRRGVSKCVDKLPGIPGVLSKRPADVALIMKALTENNLQNKVDAAAVPIAWNDKIFESKQKLRIGYIESLETFPPIGDSVLIVQRAKTFLESMGHILIPFTVPFNLSEISNLSLDSNLAGRLQTSLRNDEISSSIKLLHDHVKHSMFQKLRQLCCNFYGGTQDYVDEIAKREELVGAFLDKMSADEIDLIICPVLPFPAISVESVPYYFDALLYTVLWNWLDFPAGVVKFWKETGNHWEKSLLLSINDKPKAWKEVLTRDGRECVGLPIGIQVVGRPFNEELVLRILVELDEINS